MTPTKAKTRKQVLKMPPHWSFSRWQTYEQCPLKAKLKYIDEIVPEVSDKQDHTAADRGNEIHEVAAAWVNAPRGKAGPLPPIFHHFKDYMKDLRKRRAVAEVELGLKKDWSPCDFEDEHYWWHGAFDIVVMNDDATEAEISDWKTGKVYEQPHAQQLELYALVLFCTVPTLKKITVHDSYIDQKKTSPKKVYDRRQITMLKEIWTRRITPMFADRTFAPLPNRFCDWCEYRAEAGSGLCKYGTGRK